MKYMKEVENNTFVDKDPGFTNAAAKDYTFGADSEIVKANPEFAKVNINEMGCKKDKLYNKLSKVTLLKINNESAIANGTSKLIDSANPDVKPIIDNSRTLVPVRFISESFGANVSWDDAAREIGVTLGDKEIKMTLDSESYTVNGEAKTLDVPAKSINGRTLIPLRALVEALGKEVFWDDRGLIAISDQKDFLNAETDKDVIDFMVKYTGKY